MTDQTDATAPDAAEVTGDVDLIGAERLIFFSDAVVAIAITLLALALPLPAVGPHAHNSEVLSALGSTRHAYLPFLISFVVIGTHWRTHHRLFRHVAWLDSRLISINMVWLLMIVVTPYATRVLSGGDANSLGVRFALYAGIQVVTMVALVAMGRHIRGSRLLRPGALSGEVAAEDAIVLAVAAMFAISIPIAFVTEWAYALWVAAVLAARAVRRARSKPARTS
jgi:uncharacterized membrane protein